MLKEMGERARAASRILALSTEGERNAALEAIAAALSDEAQEILLANEADLAAGREAGLSEALLDRLALSKERIADIAQAVRQVAQLPDPVGRVLGEHVPPNGMRIRKVSVPMGVIAVIYEARPNVTADSAALCLKSGNAAILRGGKEAAGSNRAITRVIRGAIKSAGLPEDCVQLVQDVSRGSARALMTLNGYVDLLVPRGGAGLIRSVVENASVPVIETGAGTCHVYVDAGADLAMAAEILFNAKVSRPSVCNACECALIHKDIATAFLPLMAQRFTKRPVEFRADERALPFLPGAVAASEDDWGREYNDYILAVRVVDSQEAAVEHITRYGTGHSECIVTEDAEAARTFLAQVDAAAVYHNVSTRFTDGGVFGLGAEIGISTQKLHARGPLGLRELTSYKYIIEGEGQIR